MEQKLLKMILVTVPNLKDFMGQQHQGFSDSTPRAGSDRLQK